MRAGMLHGRVRETTAKSSMKTYFMPNSASSVRRRRARRVLVALYLLAGLSACGGGNSDPVATTGAAATAPSPGVMPAPAAVAPAPLPSGISAQPTYHMAAVVPPPPDDVDVGGTNASAREAPARFALSAEAADIDTAGLTPELLAAALQPGHPRAVARAALPAGGVQPASVAVYTPGRSAPPMDCRLCPPLA